MDNNHLSIEEQKRLGYLPERRQTFVPPAADRPAKLSVLPPHEIQMHVEHPAKQEVIVTTNAVDRAKGFQMIITPISFVVALLAVVVSLAFENQFLSFASLLIFWLVFAAIYVIGWALTVVGTPEFVSWYSAKRQWDVIVKEQRERWEHYRWETGRQLESRQNDAEAARAQRRRPSRLDSILDADWFPWALLASLVYFAAAVGWLLVRGGL